MATAVLNLTRNLGDFDQQSEGEVPQPVQSVSKTGDLNTAYSDDCIYSAHGLGAEHHWVPGCFSDKDHSALDAWFRFDNDVPRH